MTQPAPGGRGARATVPARGRDLDAARAIARVLDDAIRIPGTSFRIGLDPIIGLVPGLGDLVGGAVSAYYLIVAARLGAPPSVLVRMLANLGVDTLVGAIPALGDLFDAAWRANSRNLALLERLIERPREARASSRMFLVVALLVVVLLVAGALALAVTLSKLLVGLVS